MKSIEHKTVYEEYSGTEELDDHTNALILRAKRKAHEAYAPYSEFPVSCVLEMEDGSLLEATNQENMAAPSGLCAESVAFFAAGAKSDQKIIRCVVYAPKVDEPITPCGACRQVMHEYEHKQELDIELILCNGNLSKVFLIKRVQDLLPISFSLKGHKRHKN